MALVKLASMKEMVVGMDFASVLMTRTTFESCMEVCEAAWQ